jgi:hypothetical protein
MGPNGISIIILISIFIILIVYAILIFEFGKNRTWIFAPYVPPAPSAPHVYPLGEIIQLTAEQIIERNCTICRVIECDNFDVAANCE